MGIFSWQERNRAAEQHYRRFLAFPRGHLINGLSIRIDSWGGNRYRAAFLSDKMLDCCAGGGRERK